MVARRSEEALCEAERSFGRRKRTLSEPSMPSEEKDWLQEGSSGHKAPSEQLGSLATTSGGLGGGGGGGGTKRIKI